MLSTLVLALLAAVGAPALLPQDSGPETLAEMALKSLREGIEDHQIENVAEALADLDSVYTKVSPKTLKKIHKAVGTMFADLVPRKADENVRGGYDLEQDPGTEQEVAACYGMAVGMLYDKDDGPKILTTALKQKHVKDWPDVRALIYEGLGYRADPALLKDLTKALRDPAPVVVAAAATALGQFHDADMSVRKSAAAALADAYLDYQEDADREAKKGRSEDAAEVLAVVELAFDGSLTSLTRQSLEGAAAWDEWVKAHAKDAEW